MDVLSLRSPVGAADDLMYEWPQGESEDRFTEDELAQEIWDTFAAALLDHPELEFRPPPLPTSDSDDSTIFGQVQAACWQWNDAVTSYVAGRKFGKTKATSSQAQHIITQVYNQAVVCPEQLNQYSAFSPNVYGETSPKMVSHMISQLRITPEDVFLDLGSGVGQVVLQMAAAADFKQCIGIETSPVPCQFAVALEREFRKTMAWYGKRFSEFQLHQGDFLKKYYRPIIQQSTVIFANNFAFGPEVDHQLKNIFADLPNGVRIISSKEFSAINFRINDRNLSDIGSIMNVSVMQPFKDAVSWTNSKVAFFLHTIDQQKLHRYFESKPKNNSEERQTAGKRRPRRPPPTKNANSREMFNGEVNGNSSEDKWTDYGEQNGRECYKDFNLQVNGQRGGGAPRNRKCANVQKVPSNSTGSWSELNGGLDIKQEIDSDGEILPTAKHRRPGRNLQEFSNCVPSKRSDSSDQWSVKEEPVSDEDVPLAFRTNTLRKRKRRDDTPVPLKRSCDWTVKNEPASDCEAQPSKSRITNGHCPPKGSHKSANSRHVSNKGVTKNARKNYSTPSSSCKQTRHDLSSVVPSHQPLVNGNSTSHVDPYADAPWRKVVPSGPPKTVDELLASLRVGYFNMLEAMTGADFREKCLREIEAEKARNAQLRAQVERFSKHIAELRESGVQHLRRQMVELGLDPNDAESVDRCAGDLIQRQFELQQVHVMLKKEVAELEKNTPSHNESTAPSTSFSSQAIQPKKRLSLLSEVNYRESNSQSASQSPAPNRPTNTSTDVCKLSPYDLLPKKRWR
ncbi:Histone h3 methyltransferase [Nesidiocoris tenuis]|uniref:Histone-lysine N-methyltransferase, H3 lysine-79 specific n=1 Tax=Nesidiocoris tenuis TaxID=355587 RepID=A0ABN7ABB6_9HEMI|nr:Histone h3 methyltransferase [Nesidiocoris tenuis]